MSKSIHAPRNGSVYLPKTSPTRSKPMPHKHKIPGPATGSNGISLNGDHGWPPSGSSRKNVVTILRHDREVEMQLEEPASSAEHQQEPGRTGNDDLEDMEWEQTISQTSSGLAYLALDTNILIHQLASVKALHDRLIQHWPPSFLFLIPNTVVNELDKHSSSKVPAKATPPPLPRGVSIHSPAAKQYTACRTQATSLGQLARDATAWLLRVGQQRRERGWGLVRCQQFTERTQQDLGKPDDRIVDCCIHFLKHDHFQAAVWLWTDDRNLKVQAEAHDIPTIGNSALLTPDLVLAKCSPNHPARGLKTAPPQEMLEEDMSMEIDDELMEDYTVTRHKLQATAHRSHTSMTSISSSLWDNLLVTGEEGPICVACTSDSGVRPSSVVVWAEERKSTEGEVIWLPEDLMDVIGPGSVAVERHQPVCLTSVFLQPRTDGQDLPELDELLAVFPPLIFRQSASITTNTGVYKVLLTEPVLQGCITTNTSVVQATQAEAADAVNAEASEDIETTSVTSRHSLIEFDPDAFLSSALILSDSREHDEDDAPTASFYSASSSDFDSQSGSVTPRPGAASPPAVVQPISANGDAAETQRGLGINFTGTAARSRLSMSEPHGDADGSCWLTVTGLGRAGVFAGDWVLLEDAGDLPRSRLALVNVVQTSTSEQDEVPAEHIVLPPLMLSAVTGAGANNIVLRPTPFGSRLPDLPVARSITLARIASAESVDRRYEASWVAGLRNYFVDSSGQSIRRLIKRGDLLGIPVSQRQVLEDGDEDEALEEETRSAVVLFVITAISYDPLLPLESDFNSSLSSRARAGEFGCWVDGAETRMVQLGVERARASRGSIGWWGIEDPPAAFSRSAQAKLHSLLEASLSSTALKYGLNTALLVKGASGSGKSSLVQSAARDLGFHLVSIDCFEAAGDTDAITAGTLKAAAEKAITCAPCILLFKHAEALARKSESMASGQEPAIASGMRDLMISIQVGMQQSGWPVIVAATISDDDKVPAEVLAVFKQQITIQAPSEKERQLILRNIFSSVVLGPDVSLKSLAVQTAALQARDCVSLVVKAQECSLQRVAKSLGRSGSWDDFYRAGVAVNAADIAEALQMARAAYSDSIGAPKIPNVTWDDVGGLANVKSDILDTIQLPLEHPELFADGLKKRSGILLYGPPGTGKTLLAKAVATSCSLNFFSVKGPELLNMYIGESEANVRRVFQRARDAKPCVIFMDELDSVAPKRGNQGDSGGVMDRIVSQLLAELDGMSDGGNGDGVYVMAATNRPDLLDPALLRPGRFDRMLYLGVSDTHEAQLKIMQALTRKFKLDEDVDLKTLANGCPFNYTGADFYALCSDALLKAMARKAEQVDLKIGSMNEGPRDVVSKHPYPMTPQYYLSVLATPEEIDVRVSQVDFERALDELVPSVSQGEMDHYKQVQRMFSKETINGLA